MMLQLQRDTRQRYTPLAQPNVRLHSHHLLLLLLLLLLKPPCTHAVRWQAGSQPVRPDAHSICAHVAWPVSGKDNTSTPGGLLLGCAWWWLRSSLQFQG